MYKIYIWAYKREPCSFLWKYNHTIPVSCLRHLYVSDITTNLNCMKVWMTAKITSPIWNFCRGRNKPTQTFYHWFHSLENSHKIPTIALRLLEAYCFLKVSWDSNSSNHLVQTSCNLELSFYTVCRRWLWSRWKMWVTCKINVMWRKKMGWQSW